MSSQELKGFFLHDHFISRSNLLELALGAVVIAGLMIVFDSLTNDILTPMLRLLLGAPDLSWMRPFGVGIGHFLTTLFGFLLRVVSLYFLVVLPLGSFARRHSLRE